MLVLFTTIVFGAMMPKFITFFQGLDNSETNQNEDYHELKEMENAVNFDYLHPNFTTE